jgi:hypothetical protein
MRISRREFVTSVTASGIALSMSRLAIAEQIGARYLLLCQTFEQNLALVEEAGRTVAALKGKVLDERLLEKTIAEALDGHLCRCTGYIIYHEAVRAVILADPSRYLS